MKFFNSLINNAYSSLMKKVINSYFITWGGGYYVINSLPPHAIDLVLSWMMAFCGDWPFT